MFKLSKIQKKSFLFFYNSACPHEINNIDDLGVVLKIFGGKVLSCLCITLYWGLVGFLNTNSHRYWKTSIAKAFRISSMQEIELYYAFCEVRSTTNFLNPRIFLLV